jgi:hypothetical protein
MGGCESFVYICVCIDIDIYIYICARRCPSLHAYLLAFAAAGALVVEEEEEEEEEETNLVKMSGGASICSCSCVGVEGVVMMGEHCIRIHIYIYIYRLKQTTPTHVVGGGEVLRRHIGQQGLEGARFRRCLQPVLEGCVCV